jgi:hypothetical protein
LRPGQDVPAPRLGGFEYVRSAPMNVPEARLRQTDAGLVAAD